MRSSRLPVALLCGASLLVCAAPAAAAQRAITGRLSARGYTVIALGYDGRIAVARAKPSFSIRPRSSRVTLQLRDAKGRYAGPILVSRRGTRVVEGVRAGAKLGTIRVSPGRYAVSVRPVAKRWRDDARWAQAKAGAPIGAGRLGYVSSRLRTTPGGGSDQDRDGVPNVFDVDNDGDLVLDNADRAAPRGRARAAQVTCPDPPISNEPPECDLRNGIWAFSNFQAQAEDSVNADAGAFTDADIAAAMRRWVSISMERASGDSTELDCGSLPYCGPNGTGHEYASPNSGVQPAGNPANYNEGPAFPACCDADADGLGELPQRAGPGPREFQLLPEAGPAEIRPGDTYLERVTTGGVETAVPGSLNFVFTSVPALKAWTSSGGDDVAVTYPIAANGPGTQQNPWPVSAGPDGHIVLHLTFWRPQRGPVPGSGETGLMDIGHLAYYTIPNPLIKDRNAPPPTCAASDYKTADERFSPNPDPVLNGFVDVAADAPANAANTLSYSLDLTACFERAGVTLASGDRFAAGVQAETPLGDDAAQGVAFQVR